MGLKCQIVIEKPSKTFATGEIIRGRIIVINDQPINITGLQLKCEGKCVVQFFETNEGIGSRCHSSFLPFSTTCQVNSENSTTTTGFLNGLFADNETVKTEYRSEETYLKSTLSLFGSDGRRSSLPQGRHEYPFQYRLPQGLPSSFEGPHGKVSYHVVAVLLPHSIAFDSKASTTFHVVGQLNLNDVPQFQPEVTLKQYKNFGWIFSKGDFGFTLKMESRGVLIGGVFPFLVEINNKSPQTVVASASVIQEVNCHARGKARSVTTEICTVRGPSLPPGVDEMWRSSNLQVPSHIPPTNVGGECNLIDVSYFIKIKLSGSGYFSDVECQVPIVIGTHPLRPNILSFANDCSLPPPASAEPSSLETDFSIMHPEKEFEEEQAEDLEATAIPTAPFLSDSFKPDSSPFY